MRLHTCLQINSVDVFNIIVHFIILHQIEASCKLFTHFFLVLVIEVASFTCALLSYSLLLLSIKTNLLDRFHGVNRREACENPVQTWFLIVLSFPLQLLYGYVFYSMFPDCCDTRFPSSRHVTFTGHHFLLFVILNFLDFFLK